MRVFLRDRASHVLLWSALIVAAISSGGRISAQAQEPDQRWDGLIELVSGKYNYSPPTMDPPTPADGPSQKSRHAVSGDGRYVVFTANAPALGYYGPALYLRDRRLSDTRVLYGGGIGDVRDAVISEDGRHVAFTVCEQWMRPDQQTICDVWTIDTFAMSWAPVSVAMSGEFGDADSDDPVLSSTGRYIVFRTKATNLVNNPSGVEQLVLRDRDPDGNGVFDQPLGPPEIVSAPISQPGSVPANGDSATPEISEDGRFVAFRSAATNLVPGDTNNAWDVFRRDRFTRNVKRVNLRPFPSGSNESPYSVDSPAISMTSDGRYVAFASRDPQLSPAPIDDTNNVNDVFLYDANNSSPLYRIDVGYGPPVAGINVPGNGPTEWPTISAGGRYVSVQSSAMNVENPPHPQSPTQAYVFDRVTNKVTRISIKPDGTEPDHGSFRPEISADGTLVAFVSQAFNLTPNAYTDSDRVYAAVHFEITPEEQSVPGGAGNRATYSVVTQDHTPWWLDWNSWQPWTDFETPVMQWGRGLVTIRTNEANPNPTPRTATIKIFEKTARFIQLEGLSLTSISPIVGPDTGGTQVTFTGTGFEPGMQIFFGGLEAIAVEYVDSTTLIATTPAHAPDTVDVAITTGPPDWRMAWLDQAFRYTDTTPPQLWYGFSDTPNENGWFRTNVTIGWAWWDQETPVTSTSGCDMTVIATDTPGSTYTCTATSEGGTSSMSAFVKRDATAPTVAFTTPQSTLYDLNEVVQPAFTCSDALSGVASCESSTNGQPLDTSMPGYHTFSAWGMDRAGNLGGASIDYAVGSGVCTPGLPDNLGWWRMEGNTLNTRSNSTTAVATRVGLTSDVYVDGVVGQGYQFAGANGYLQTPFHYNFWGGIRKWGMAAWVKPSANTLGTIVRRREGYSLARLANGSIGWAFRLTTPSGLSYHDTGVKLPLNVWSHVVVVLDWNEVRTYLNGRLAHTAANIGTIYATESHPVTIGGSDSNADFFKGVLDEVQLFENGLNAEQVEQLFLSGNAGACVPKKTTFQIVQPIPAAFGSPTYSFDVRLVDEDGNPVPGRSVELMSQVGAWPYSTSTANRVTDGDGRVHWDAPLKNAPRGLFEEFTGVTFSGDAEYVRQYTEPDVLVGKGNPVITWPAPAPITYSFPVNSTQLNATASVPGTFSYSPVSGTLLPAGTQTLTATFTPTNTADYNTVTTTNTLVVNKATPNVVIEGAGAWPYTGTPRAVVGKVKDRFNIVIATPALTYNGSPDAPTLPGTYTVEATFPGNANYLAGSATATLTINKAVVDIQITANDVTYNGSPFAAGYLISGIHPETLPADSVTYNGSENTPVNAGTYTVVVTFNGTAIYEAATASKTFTIHKATPTVTVTGGTFTYDGAVHPATGTVTGGGGASLGAPVFTYYGPSAEPVNAGTYEVVGTFAGDANHNSATGSATITITPATPTVTVTGGTFTYDGTPHGASVIVTGVGGADLGPGALLTYNGSIDVPVNAGTYVAVATYDGTGNYGHATGSAVVTILKATVVLNWSQPAAIVYGTSLGGDQLNATANAFGSFDYSPAANTVLNAGAAQTLTATFTPADPANYIGGTVNTTIDVSKAAAEVTAIGGTFTYNGQPHPATGFVTGVNGAQLGTPTFTYNGNAQPPVTVGIYEVVASFAGNGNYEPASATTAVAVLQATAILGWEPVEAIVYGTPLGDAQLRATANIPGTFTYLPPAGTVLDAGAHVLTARFTPDDPNYSSDGIVNTGLDVTKAAPVLTWSAPAAIVYGTALGSTQLDATANIAGTFSYSPAAGTVLNAGASQTLSATFTPADMDNYSSGSVSVTIDVSRAAATVTATGGTFTYDGQPHPATGSVTGLNGASLGTPSFTYNGLAEPPVNSGSYAVVASFAGNANYEPASANATISIGQAAAALNWNAPAGIVYGTPLGAAQLNATANVPGAFAYSPAPGSVLGVGSHQLHATFTPADPANYSGGSVSTSIAVGAAPLAIRANDAAKPFGAPLPAFSASAAGFVNGDTFASLSGTLAFATSATASSPVGTYPVTPSGLSSPNYAITYVNGALSVVRGNVAVSVVTSPLPSGLNQLMTFTANVAAAAPAAGVPSGTVRFFDGATLLGSGTLASGSASLTTAGLTAGAHTIEARYDGNASFETGVGSASHTVNGASSTPTIGIASNRNPATVGQSVTLTASLSMSAGPVTGTVEFYDGATLLGSRSIASGSASFTTTAFAVGAHAITVRYLGSASAPPVRSGVFVETVGTSNWKNRTSTTTLSASPNPSALGDSVTLTANVTGSSGTPTGSVLFMVNGQVVGGPVTLTTISGSTGRATFVVSGLPGGRHTVTATYLANSNYKGSTASAVQTVN